MRFLMQYKYFLPQPFLIAVLSFFCLTQSLLRLVLAIYALVYNQASLVDLPSIFACGLVNDFVTFAYIGVGGCALELLFYCFAPKVRRYLAFVFFTIFAAVICSSAVCEFYFWDEFGTRFNFIAVDYLVYTHEIIGTVKDSLPIPMILSSIAIFSLTSAYLFILCKAFSHHSVINIFLPLGFYLLFSGLTFVYYQPLIFSKNVYATELARNGLYELFSAFRNNSLNYTKFYPNLDNQQALEVARNQVLVPNQRFLTDDSLERIVSGTRANKHNVVLIVVESLSAKFMERFGNQEKITPYLDKLSKESIFFTNFYATGTRTVRGLEAIVLSIPPTPGSSIIRRPNVANLFTAGQVMQQHGYDTSFIYGGYAYFDNMKHFFSSNGFNCIDRGDLAKNEISFSNVWGVADEDIFKKALQYFDSKAAEKKPFFSLVLTTSNHRPYDFPAGRIDLAPGSNRAAAVKYTDYAIAGFIQSARTRPWFDNTIFVIVADHCASSAGKVQLPAYNYHIPLFIYAPALLKPQEITSISSQIDVMPTIFGILGLQYKSKFFGRDVINYPAGRAFISTYQLLGYLHQDELAILTPNQGPKTYRLNGFEQNLAPNNSQLTEQAISMYQSAYILYNSGKLFYDSLKQGKN